MTTHDIHVLPFSAIGGRPHAARVNCWCGPISVGETLDSAAVAYRHRQAPTVDRLTPRQRAARADFESFGIAPWIERGDGDAS